jgi:uncharacterized protein YuzE
MQKLVSVRVDYDDEIGPTGYLRFHLLAEGGHVARTQRVSDDVFVDFNGESQILGIEFLALDTEVLDLMQKFTEAHDLEFPEMLRHGPVPA